MWMNREKQNEHFLSLYFKNEADVRAFVRNGIQNYHDVAEIMQTSTFNVWLQRLYFSEPRQSLIRPNDWNKFGHFSFEFSRSGTVSFDQWGETDMKIHKISNQSLGSTWQLVTYTFGKEESDSKSKIFIDGNLVMEARPTWTSKLTLGDCTIGGFLTNHGESHGNLNCNIDEILILQKRWSEKEIKKYFRSGFPYYQLDPDLLVHK